MANSNLGGLCGHSCIGKIGDTDENRYSTATGLCTYEPVALTAPCGASDMYYTGVATTQAGVQVDLRVNNASEYLPFQHDANGLSGQWGAIQVLGNTAPDFLFEFVDNVRRGPRSRMPAGGPVAGRVPRCPPPSPANQPPLNRRSPAPLCRSPRPQKCWTSSASRSSTSMAIRRATRRW